MDFSGHGDFSIHTVATNHTIGILHVPDPLATTAFGDFLIHTVNPAHTLSYKPLVGQWTTCLVSLLRCHLVYRLPSSSRYTTRLLSDVVFTGVVRQRCQSCLLLLSNQRASARLGSAHFGSTRHGMEKHRWRGRCLPSDAPSTSHYIITIN
jgi:hypothetical protein